MDIEETLKLVCSFLNKNDMRYVIVEGIAVMYHGVPRTTVDIDFILDLDETEIDAFMSYLGQNRFDIEPKAVKELLKDGSYSTAFVGDSLLHLDLQAVNSEFDRLTVDRAIQVQHLGTKMRLGSVEDTLINKLLFQGEQDLRDALGILTRHEEEIDETYIEDTCRLLGILDYWHKFRENYQENRGTSCPVEHVSSYSVLAQLIGPTHPHHAVWSQNCLFLIFPCRLRENLPCPNLQQ